MTTIIFGILGAPESNFFTYLNRIKHKTDHNISKKQGNMRKDNSEKEGDVWIYR